MNSKTYTTKEIAEINNVHPNTVRLYEKWGYISKVKRKKNNYRVFTEKHLHEMKLARIALPGPYPIDGKIVHQLVKVFADDNIIKALELAQEYSRKVEIEADRAVAALEVLDKWFQKKAGDKNITILKTRKNASSTLGISIDTLRTWERNALFNVKKDSSGILAFSQWDIEKIMIIRLLRNCGYSIASLLKVFTHEESYHVKPSEILLLHDESSDISYDTDRYLEFLEEHKKRSQAIITILKASIERD